MDVSIIEKLCKRAIAFHIAKVCRHPYWFIVVPFIVVILLAPCNFMMDYRSDHKYLVGATGSYSLKERDEAEKLFPNSSTFGRETGPRRFGRIIISLLGPNQGSSILDSITAKNEILRLDHFICENVSVHHGGKLWRYGQLCSQHLHGCFENPGVRLAHTNYSKVKYPRDRDINGEVTIYSAALGGVTLDKDGYVTGAKAIQLHYLLRTDTPEFIERSDLWEKEFVSQISSLSFSAIKIYLYASHLYQKEFDDTSNSVLPKMWISVILLTIFGFLAFYQRDCTKSKITLGLITISSTSMAAVAACGLCVVFGVPFTPMNLVIPFILLGIGMDDTLVILAVWWASSGNTVEERLLKTFDHCGISVTATSVTNIVSFAFGIAAPFVYLRIFCIYTVASMALLYILQMTFLAGFLVLAARREMEGLNTLWFLPVINKGKGEVPKNFLQKYLLTTEGADEWKISNSIGNVFFSKHLGSFLVATKGRIVVFLSLLVYLGFSGYGVFNLSVEPKFGKIFQDNSYSAHFIRMEEKYFPFHSYRIQVIIRDEIDYSDILVQTKLANLVARLESSVYIDSAHTEFWLPPYLEFLKMKRFNHTFNNSSSQRKERFLYFLRQRFLKLPMSWPFTHDIKFNRDETGIAHSRFYIQSTEVKMEFEVNDLLSHLNDIVNSFPLNIGYYNERFYFLEHNSLIIPFAFVSITTISVAIILVLFLIVPNLKVIFWTATTLIFIEVGVIGCLTYLNILFDIASITGIIMCIGFSVDSCIHITYAFVNSKELSNESKLKEALEIVGMAVVKTACTGILCNLSLYFIPAYFCQTIFKMTLIILIFSTYQSLIVLPTLLGIFYDLGVSQKYSLNNSNLAVLSNITSLEKSRKIEMEEKTGSSEEVNNTEYNMKKRNGSLEKAVHFIDNMAFVEEK